MTKIGIVSDSHDNLKRIKKVFAWFGKKEIGPVIHCGDLASPSTLKEAMSCFSGELLFSLGNADGGKNWEEVNLPKVKIYSVWGQKRIYNRKIAFCHYPELAQKLAREKDLDFIFYGHTHRPWQETINGCCLINPGNLAGLLYKATFAVLDCANNDLQLKVVDDL